MPEPLTVGAAGATGGLGALLVSLFDKWMRRDSEKTFRSEVKASLTKMDDKIDELALDLARDYLPKSEVISLHKDLNVKLDLVITELSKINVSLAQKVDK